MSISFPQIHQPSLPQMFHTVQKSKNVFFLGIIECGLMNKLGLREKVFLQNKVNKAKGRRGPLDRDEPQRTC